MSFCLKLRAGLAAETRRVAFEELTTAVERLRSGDIHQTRRSLKQVRALLDLAHDDFARNQSQLFRDAARRLAATRDREVSLRVLTELGETRFRPERALFRQARAALGSRAGLGKSASAVALRSLESALVSLADWTPNVSIKSFEQRLRRSWRRGRRAVQAAKLSLNQLVDSGVPAGGGAGNPEDLHELRKCIKLLWAQLRLLRRCRPGLMKKLIREADGIAELLGDEHDLAILNQRLSKARVLAKLGPLAGFLVQRRAELGHKAVARAECFFEEKPRRFARRIFSKT
ncbi:MAG: CHAD domain-containing protein [Verrucomicrobiota bacterium]